MTVARETKPAPTNMPRKRMGPKISTNKLSRAKAAIRATIPPVNASGEKHQTGSINKNAQPATGG